jgi:crotonobetainyl-CoA:carnitine CoA-transferase CaiB-like acyl-CoA transferase
LWSKFWPTHLVVLRTDPSPYKVGADREHTAAPAPGRDTDAVLSDLLGYSADEIADLRAAGAV